MVDVEDRVVIGVVEFFDGTPACNICIVAGGNESRELGRMPVGIQRPMAATTEVQHHESVSRSIGSKIALQQWQDVFVVALAAVAAVADLDLTNPRAIVVQGVVDVAS